MTPAGLLELQEAAARPEARPSAAQLLPGAQAAEGIPRLEKLLVSAAARAPRELAGAAVDLLRAGGKRVRPLLVLLSARAAGGHARGTKAGRGHAEAAGAGATAATAAATNAPAPPATPSKPAAGGLFDDRE